MQRCKEENSPDYFFNAAAQRRREKNSPDYFFNAEAQRRRGAEIQREKEENRTICVHLCDLVSYQW